MNDIASWLEKLGLGKYAELFAENDIDFEVLPHLSEAHLESLSISPGHRIKLLQAIKTLSNAETVAAVQTQDDVPHDRVPAEIDSPLGINYQCFASHVCVTAKRDSGFLSGSNISRITRESVASPNRR